MNPRGSAASLGEAVKELSIKWQQTQTYWRDVKSQEFEKNYLDALPSYVARALMRTLGGPTIDDLHRKTIASKRHNRA